MEINKRKKIVLQPAPARSRNGPAYGNIYLKESPNHLFIGAVLSPRFYPSRTILTDPPDLSDILRRYEQEGINVSKNVWQAILQPQLGFFPG